MAADTTTWWEILDSIGSFMGGLGTVGAAAMAARIAWLVEYGTRPFIESGSFGRRGSGLLGKEQQNIYSMKLTNRRKSDVSISEIYVGGLPFHIRESSISCDAGKISHLCGVDWVSVRLDVPLKTAESKNIEISFVSEGEGWTDRFLTYSALLTENVPRSRRYWIRFDFGRRRWQFLMFRYGHLLGLPKAPDVAKKAMFPERVHR